MNPNAKIIIFVSIIAATAILLLLSRTHPKKPITVDENVPEKLDTDNVESTTVDTENIVVHGLRHVGDINDIVRMNETLADIIIESLASPREITKEGVIQVDGEWITTSRTHKVYDKIRVNPDSPEIVEFVQIAKEKIEESRNIPDESRPVVNVIGDSISVTYRITYEPRVEWPHLGVVMDAMTKEITGVWYR